MTEKKHNFTNKEQKKAVLNGDLICFQKRSLCG